MNKLLTNKQICFILYSSIVGYGIINLPKNVGEAAGTAGWIPLLILTILAMLITYVVTYVSSVYENGAFYDYCKKSAGRIVSGVFLALFVTYYFVLFTMTTRIYAETMNLTILNNTPAWSICLLFFVVEWYALSKGLNVLGRMCELYGILNVLGFIFMSIILFTQGKMVNARPLWMPRNVTFYAKACSRLTFPFLGMKVLLFMPVSKTSNRNICKQAALMTGFIGILYVCIVESTISVAGVETIINYKASIFRVVKGVDVEYLEFFRRLDGLYLIFWTINIFSSICIWGYVLSTCIMRFSSKIQYDHLAMVMTFIAFTTSQLPRTMDDVELLLKYNGYLGILLVLTVPFTLLMIMKVKKHEKKVL